MHHQPPSNALSLANLIAERLNSFFRSQPHSLPINLYETIIQQVEEPLIIETLKIANGNQLKAAEILGLNRNTLRKKITSFNINPSDYK
jgi:DNA-binding protein Fis